MRTRIKALLGLTAAVMSASALFPVTAQAATAAPAISTVNCGSDPQGAGYTFFVTTTQKATCYANAGDVAANLPDIYEVCSGNNVLQFNYNLQGLYYTQQMPKYLCRVWNQAFTVYEVRIS
jgi:Beta/Gamma crystallin